MSGAFFHFWLAERSDVAALATATGADRPAAVTCRSATSFSSRPTGTPYTGTTLKGEYRIVTLFTRTGQITSNDNVQFDNPANPANGTYNPGIRSCRPSRERKEGGSMIARLPRMRCLAGASR